MSEDPWIEAAISIDGVPIARGESATVRIALVALAGALQGALPLEEAERAHFFRERAHHILSIIANSIKRQRRGRERA